MSEQKDDNAVRSNFLEEKAFQSRTVLVFGTINDKQAADVSKRLIALAAESADPVTVLVSSPGGHVESGDVIHDMIRFTELPVNMVGSGWVGSSSSHSIFVGTERKTRLSAEYPFPDSSA
jgi:ATP-dependent Clp protease protease subunit